MTELPLSPKLMPLESAKVILDRFKLVVPADRLMLDIVAAFEAIAVVRYAPAFRLMPELFTVHVTFVWAVFNPTASLLALAVVKPLCEAVIVPLLDRPKVIPLLLANSTVPVLWVWAPEPLIVGPPPPPGAATLIEIALEAIVPEALVPLKTALAWTKSVPRFEAIAVVRAFGADNWMLPLE